MTPLMAMAGKRRKRGGAMYAGKRRSRKGKLNPGLMAWLKSHGRK